jgi:hypothetical protein
MSNVTEQAASNDSNSGSGPQIVSWIPLSLVSTTLTRAERRSFGADMITGSHYSRFNRLGRVSF